MYEGNPIDICMARVVLDEGFFDRTVYPCEIIKYNPEEERIYILTRQTELPVFSLDAIYRASISTPEGVIECEGIIEERYWNKLGRVMVFLIKNGFYKKVIN